VPSEKEKLLIIMTYWSQLTKTEQRIPRLWWKIVLNLLCVVSGQSYGHIKALPCLKAVAIFHHLILLM